MSTLFVNNLNTATGSTITIPTGKQLIGTDISSIVAPGHVIQVVTYADNTNSGFQTASTSYVTSSIMPGATITPKFSNSKILIQAMIGMQHDETGQIKNTIYRTIGGTATDLPGGNAYGLAFKGVGTGTFWTECSITWSDSPGTTNAVEYKWYSKAEAAVNISPMHNNTSVSMTLMEIAQ